VVLLFVALLAVAANAVSFHKHHKMQINPFEGIPNFSSLGFCWTECAPLSQVQMTQSSDNSGACTPTFASQVTTCGQCIATLLPTALLTNPVKQKIQDGITYYESQCAAAGSPVTVDLGNTFKIESTTTPALAAAAATPTTTLSSTGSPSPSISMTGTGYVIAPSFEMAVAVVIAVFAAI